MCRRASEHLTANRSTVPVGERKDLDMVCREFKLERDP